MLIDFTPSSLTIYDAILLLFLCRRLNEPNLFFGRSKLFLNISKVQVIEKPQRDFDLVGFHLLHTACETQISLLFFRLSSLSLWCWLKKVCWSCGTRPLVVYWLHVLFVFLTLYVRAVCGRYLSQGVCFVLSGKKLKYLVVSVVTIL